MTVGGVDTYYDYDERQWKFRRLGGGPVRRPPDCPRGRPLGRPQSAAETDESPAPELSPESADG